MCISHILFEHCEAFYYVEKCCQTMLDVTLTNSHRLGLHFFTAR